jgi:DNA (cytosine-5)-methyltransferase 1
MRTRLANEKGYESLVCPPFALNVNHAGDDGRPYRLDSRPLAPRTTRIGDGLARPFVTMLRNNGEATAIADPLAAVATARHHGLTTPPGAFYVKYFTPRSNWGQMSKDVRTEPLGAITADDHHSLVVPYRRGAKPYRAAAAPISAVATHEQHGLIRPAIDINDCHFRMLKPREHLRAQRFPDSYTVAGNKGEQTMQAGNAVSANVAHWLGRAIVKALA